MMSEIGGWLYSVFVISLSAGAIEIFAPVGETKKYIKYVISLVVLIAIVSPLVRVLSFVPELLDGLSYAASENNTVTSDITVSLGDGQIYKDLADAGRRGIEESVCSSVCERFSLGTEDIKVSVILDESDQGNIRIESVTVCMPNDDVFASRSDIVTYVKEITGCERVTAVDESESE